MTFPNKSQNHSSKTPGCSHDHCLYGSLTTSCPQSTSTTKSRHGDAKTEEVPCGCEPQVLRQYGRRLTNETVDLRPNHGSLFRPLQSSASQVKHEYNKRQTPNSTALQDDEYYSTYESEDDPAERVGTNMASLAPQSAQTSSINRASSTVTQINRSSISAAFPIHTLKPDAAFRANPHGCVREHILFLNEQWTATRDINLAAPLRAEWRDCERSLAEARKAAHAAHLHREVKADKAWLPRKLYLRASDWLFVRRQQQVEEHKRAALRTRLDARYVAQQLEQRKVVAEAQLSSAALETNSGDRFWGQFLHHAYWTYLSEDAGRIFLPIRAEVDIAGDGRASRAPRWLEPRYQRIDCGDGKEVNLIVRFFR